MLVQFQDNSQSPFDSIKHISESGREYWSARDLMQILGYTRWENFKLAIETAKENLEIQGSNTLENFLPLERKSSGRTGLDYHLSRLACYHVALSCDSRGKDAVKMAKHYFVVKAREAEVTIPKQNEQLEILKLQNENLKLENSVAQSQLALLQFRHTISLTCSEPVQQKVLGYQVIEKPEYRDRIIKDQELINDGSTITKTALCGRYNISTKNGKPDFKRLNGILDRLNIPDDAFDDTMVIRTNKELKREFLPTLDRLFLDSNRQLHLGE